MASPAASSGPSSAIDPELARIVQRVAPGARVLDANVLGVDPSAVRDGATAKAAGYGTPVKIDAQVDGERRVFVLHGVSVNQFGHERRSDRAAELLLAADTFDAIPRHTHVLDVGAFKADGSSVSLLGAREFYLLTDYATGHRYADDLRRIAERGAAQPADLEQVTVLTRYLADLHAERHDDPHAYARSLRDLFGSGQGIFGIVDGYGAHAAGASPAQLQDIERACLEWRWRAKSRPSRLSRIHGDFHPFNVLFDGPELHVLDTSRGSLGDPADDVAAMAINYVFFALDRPASWHGAFQGMWQRFWESYLTASRDSELLDVVAPFLAWRTLVVACPVWYPDLPASARERLLAFAQAVLRSERFDPELVEAVFW